MKLSHGKFDAGDSGQAYLRRLFLERVSDVRGVIKKDADLDRPSLERGLRLPLYSGELWPFLHDWSKAWHLDADWIRNSAYELLLTWPGENAYLTYTGPLPRATERVDNGPRLTSQEEFIVENYGGFGRTRVIIERHKGGVSVRTLEPPTLPEYYPTLLHPNRKAYLEQAKAIALQYCERVEKSLSAAKCMDDPVRDVEWAVRFQVEERDWTDLADEEHSIEKPRKAVTRVLDYIGLERRAVRRGRKKGSKNNPILAELGQHKNVRYR